MACSLSVELSQKRQQWMVNYCSLSSRDTCFPQIDRCCVWSRPHLGLNFDRKRFDAQTSLSPVPIFQFHLSPGKLNYLTKCFVAYLPAVSYSIHFLISSKIKQVTAVRLPLVPESSDVITANAGVTS